MPQETGMAHRQLHPGMEVELDHPNIRRTAVWRVWRPVPEAIIESNILHGRFDFEHTDVWTVLPMFCYQTSLVFFNIFPCNNGLFFSISFSFANSSMSHSLWKMAKTTILSQSEPIRTVFHFGATTFDHTSCWWFCLTSATLLLLSFILLGMALGVVLGGPQVWELQPLMVLLVDLSVS